MQERAMATVRRIDDISDIEGADKIELAHVGGWRVVVRKSEYRIGDLAVYCEIDSWIPHTVAPFLTKDGHYPKVYNEVEGQRLKTVKLRGELSQGLLLPIDHCISVSGCWSAIEEGTDVSEWLNITKWEKPINAQLAGIQRGNFPTAIPKTTQERVQNSAKLIAQYLNSEENYFFEVTEKLHGSSCTMFLDSDGVFHVCSRNIDLIETETNSFWKIARQLNVEENMKTLDLYNVAIQGELIGEGINGNQYGVTLEFYVFDIYDVYLGMYMSPHRRLNLCRLLGIKHVPVITTCALQTFTKLGSVSDCIEDILEFADGPSELNNSKREGLVFKCARKPDVSFKAVSNKWLLAGGDDQ